MAIQKGFTLIELLIVLAVISIIAAIGHPVIADVSHRAEFKAEARNLASWLRQAKTEAIKANCNVVIEINSNEYTIFLDNSSTKGAAGDGQKQPEERLLATCKIRPGLTLSSNFKNNKAHLKSTPNITAGRFIIQDTQGEQIHIILNTIGRVRIEQPRKVSKS